MKVIIRTKHGPVAAEKLAAFEAGRPVYIAVILCVPGQKGTYDYYFTTGKKWCYEDVTSKIEL